MLNLSRRGFLLGATGAGLLSIVPGFKILAPLLKEEAIINPGSDWIQSSIKLSAAEELSKTVVPSLKNGLYFNNKLIHTENFVLNMHQNLISCPDLLGFPHRLPGLIDVELEADNIFVEAESLFTMIDLGDEIKVDIVSGSVRYTGDFILTKYTLSGGYY